MRCNASVASVSNSLVHKNKTPSEPFWRHKTIKSHSIALYFRTGEVTEKTRLWYLCIFFPSYATVVLSQPIQAIMYTTELAEIKRIVLAGANMHGSGAKNQANHFLETEKNKRKFRLNWCGTVSRISSKKNHKIQRQSPDLIQSGIGSAQWSHKNQFGRVFKSASGTGEKSPVKCNQIWYLSDEQMSRACDFNFHLSPCTSQDFEPAKRHRKSRWYTTLIEIKSLKRRGAGESANVIKWMARLNKNPHWNPINRHLTWRW